MANSPTLAQLYSQLARAETALAAAWDETSDMDRKRMLIDLGHAYASLAQASATWLGAQLPG